MPLDPSALTCATHPHASAVAACVTCGRLVCADCRTIDSDGLTACPGCAAGADASAEPSMSPAEAPAAAPTLSAAADPAPAAAAAEPPAHRDAADARDTDDAPDTDDASAAEPDDQAGWRGDGSRLAGYDDAPLPDWARRSQAAREAAEPEPAPSDHPPNGPRPRSTPADAPEGPTVVVVAPPPQGIPWEDDEGGDVQAFFRTAGAALRSPMQFPLLVPYLRRNDLLTPLLFALLCALQGHAVAAFTGAFGGRQAPLPIPPAGLPALPPLPAYVWDLLFMPALPLVFATVLFIQAGMAHGLLGVVGARRAPFSATFRVFAYAQVGQLLVGVPVIGRYAVDLYAVFLIMGGLRVAQGAGFVAGMLALVPMMLLNSLFSG